jgi:hypothetical protein
VAAPESTGGRWVWAWHLHDVLVNAFVASHATAPEDLILDFDAPDDSFTTIKGIQDISG